MGMRPLHKTDIMVSACAPRYSKPQHTLSQLLAASQPSNHPTIQPSVLMLTMPTQQYTSLDMIVLGRMDWSGFLKSFEAHVANKRDSYAC